MRYITVIPAYGRDYKSAKAVREAWSAGKDFMICDFRADDGRYVNKADLAGSAGKVTINVRFNGSRSVVPIRI